MGFCDDERGQAIQIGAVLLFAVLVIAFATYQAFVVPDQNRGIEFSHSQEVQGQLQDLRNGIVSIPGGGSSRSVSVELGVRYPSRAVAINPGPATGSLRTAGTTDSRVNVSVANATTDGETGDFWNGDARDYASGALVYTPNYNEYQGAPRTVYENTVLSNEFRSRNLTVTDQRLIEGRVINLVTLNGSLSVARSSATSIDLRAVSTSTRTVSVTNATDGENVTVAVATRLDESTWRSLLDGELVEDGGHVYDLAVEPIPESPFRRLEIRLEADVRYSLRLTRVGVGTRVETPEKSYLTSVAGNGSSVPEGGTQRVVVEARDAFNNPVTGVSVNATVATGSVTPTTDTTDGDGRIAFTYRAPDDVDGSPKAAEVNASLAVDPSTRGAFDPRTVDNVTFSLTVRNTDGSGTGGSDSAYGTNWLDPSGQSGVTCSEPAETCTLDASQSLTATLTMATNPVADGATVQYAVGDAGVATVSPTTGETNGAGENETVLTARSDGTVSVYTSSGGSGDRIEMTVEDYPATTGADQLEYVSGTAGTPSNDKGISFDVTNTGSDGVTITEFSVETKNDASEIVELSRGPNDEVTISGGGTDGYANRDTRFGNPGFATDGTRYPLDGNAVVDAGNDATVEMREFKDSDGDTVKIDEISEIGDRSSADVVVELVTDGGSAKEVYFDVSTD
jgi:hypothetical protein